MLECMIAGRNMRCCESQGRLRVATWWLRVATLLYSVACGMLLTSNHSHTMLRDHGMIVAVIPAMIGQVAGPQPMVTCPQPDASKLF